MAHGLVQQHAGQPGPSTTVIFRPARARFQVHQGGVDGLIHIFADLASLK